MLGLDGIMSSRLAIRVLYTHMSEKFVVSARKYRPDSFESLLGQEAVSETLRRSILQQKTAHAYLFCGPRGVGKTSAARIFAKAINCASPLTSGEACGTCESCRAFEAQRSFNVFELDAASNNSANDIRQLIEEVSIPPQVGQYKVYIIDEVHMLSTAAFNAFLKTLEEPPEYVVFILATTEKHKILPTILSRCQVFDFKPIPSDVIVRQLLRIAQIENIQVEPKALELIAREADGGMRDALSVFDRIASYTDGKVSYSRTLESLNILDEEYYFKFVDNISRNDYSANLVLLDELLLRGFDPKTIIMGLTDFLRSLLLAIDNLTLPLLHLSEETAISYSKLAQKCGRGFLYQALARLLNCLKEYRNSNAKRLLVEMTLMSLTSLAQEGISSATPSPAQTPQSPSVGGARPQPQQAGASAPRPTPSAPIAPTPTRVVPKGPIPSGVNPKPMEQVPMPQVEIPRPSAPAPIHVPMPRQAVKEVQKKEESTPANPSKEGKPFSEEDMQIAWNTYAADYLQNNVFLQGAFRDVIPQLHNDTEVHVAMINRPQVNAVERIKNSIVEYLRRELRNGDITLHIRQAETKEEVEEQTGISPWDRFVQMASDPKTLVSQMIQELRLRPI